MEGIDSNVITVLITLVTVLGSGAAWQFYEKRMNLRHEENEKDKKEHLLYRDDLRERVAVLESKLEQYKNQLKRACVELAKDWRTDRYLRRLEAMMIVADKDISLLLSGTGDVIESDDGILAIGSGGPYANSAAKALIKNTNLNAKEIAIESLNIAADICIYTNHNIISETIEL